MNLKDYQRGRNDGLALALKIVQERNGCSNLWTDSGKRRNALLTAG